MSRRRRLVKRGHAEPVEADKYRSTAAFILLFVFLLVSLSPSFHQLSSAR